MLTANIIIDKMYGKSYQSMYTGSLLGAGPDVFSVWGWIIAHVVDGIVEINPAVISFVIGKITPEDVCKVITFLCQTDENSRTQTEDGRRLIPLSEAKMSPGRAIAYRVVNHAIYRDFKNPKERRDYMRDYMRRRRAKEAEVNSVNKCKPVNAKVRHTEEENCVKLEF